MKIKSYILSAVGLLGISMGLTTFTTTDPVEASQGCSLGMSRNAVAQYIEPGSGYPGSCRISTCKTISMISTYISPGSTGPGGIFNPPHLVYQYRANTGNMPPNACPSSVSNGFVPAP